MYERTNEERCPYCGEIVRAGTNYCNWCGKELPSSRGKVPPVERSPEYCPQCGAKLSPNMRFCPNCAAPINGDRKYKPPRPVPFRPNFVFLPKKNSIQEFCGCVAALILNVALTLHLICEACLNITNILFSIPEIIICVGCWMCFATAQRKALTSSGLRLITGTLTFDMVVGCIGSVVGVILGFIVMVFGAEYKSGIVIFSGLIIMAICGACFYAVWRYWDRLHLTAMETRRVVETGSGKISGSLYDIVLLYIVAGLTFISKVGTSSISGLFWQIYYNSDMYYYMPDEYSDIVSGVLNAILPQSGFLSALDMIASITVPVMAAIILQKFRTEIQINHFWEK